MTKNAHLTTLSGLFLQLLYLGFQLVLLLVHCTSLIVYTQIFITCVGGSALNSCCIPFYCDSYKSLLLCKSGDKLTQHFAKHQQSI